MRAIRYDDDVDRSLKFRVENIVGPRIEGRLVHGKYV